MIHAIPVPVAEPNAQLVHFLVAYCYQFTWGSNSGHGIDPAAAAVAVVAAVAAGSLCRWAVSAGAVLDRNPAGLLSGSWTGPDLSGRAVHPNRNHHHPCHRRRR